MKAIKVFYSYAHEDKILRDELDKHLGTLKRQGLINVWHDRDISAGKEWEREIDTHLNKAHIILLLISKNFIHSDYCYSVEMNRAIERCEAKKAIIIPIILSSCDWEGLPFSKYQVLPKNEQPINSRYWRNRDEAFMAVAQGIREVVQSFLDLQQIVETGEIQPLSALTKKPQSLPRTNRAKTTSATNTSKADEDERTLAAEITISEAPPIKKPLPRQGKISLNGKAQDSRGLFLPTRSHFIEQSFSSKEFERCSKGNSGFALSLYFLLDVVGLSMLIGNGLGSLQLTWLFIPIAFLIFAWGLFNINNPIAIILSIIVSGVWGIIATHYESWQPIVILALVAVLTCFHFFLFRKHEKRGLFTLF